MICVLPSLPRSHRSHSAQRVVGQGRAAQSGLGDLGTGRTRGLCATDFCRLRNGQERTGTECACVAATCCDLAMNRMALLVRAQCSVQSSGKAASLLVPAVLSSLGRGPEALTNAGDSGGYSGRTGGQSGHTQVADNGPKETLVFDASPRTAHRTRALASTCTRSIQ